MSKAPCGECGKSADTRSMRVCGGCGSYICGDCERDHRICCDNEQ